MKSTLDSDRTGQNAWDELSSFSATVMLLYRRFRKKKKLFSSNSLYQILNPQTWKFHSTTLSRFIPGNEIHLHVPTLEAICLPAECNSTIPKINILDPDERIIFSEIIHEHSLFQFETWNFKNTILGEKQLNYLDFFSSLWLIRVLFVSEKADMDCGRKLKQDDFLAGGFMFTCFYLYLVKIPILTNDFSHGLKPTTSLHWAQQLFPDDGEIVKPWSSTHV